MREWTFQVRVPVNMHVVVRAATIEDAIRQAQACRLAESRGSFFSDGDEWVVVSEDESDGLPKSGAELQWVLDENEDDVTAQALPIWNHWWSLPHSAL